MNEDEIGFSKGGEMNELTYTTEVEVKYCPFCGFTLGDK